MGINSFTIDLLLSGFVYVILTYLAFMLMKKKNRKADGPDEGGTFQFQPPKIDLPPGVSWPRDNPKALIKEPEEA